MSLKEPQLKMSKSHADPNSRILITDTEDDIKTKIKEALTDSESGITYDPEGRPGVSNLLEILKHATQCPSTCEELAKDLSNLTLRQLKDHVSQAVVKCLSGIREAYLELILPSNNTITLARETGRIMASARAGQTMKQIREHVGLRDEQWPKKPKEGVKIRPRRPLVRKYASFVGSGRTEKAEAQMKPSPSYVRLDPEVT
jgi:tryptophanyl-tRNA synthetase